LKTDCLFYRLFHNWPDIALNMLQLPYAAEQYQFVSEEIKQTSFRLDGIFKPQGEHSANQELPIIFIEVQYQPDADFYGRFMAEIMLYLYQNKPNRDWLALVIYPDRKTEKHASKEFAPLLTHLQRIYLEDYQNTKESVFALLRLIACPETETVSWAQQVLQQREPLSPAIIEFMETVLVYKLPTLSREEVKAMLGLNDVQLKQTRFYQEIAEEERREGKLEGIHEGIHEGQIQFLSHMLSQRFGPLPEHVQLKLQKADAAQLKKWGEQLWNAKSLDDVFDQ
jgi:predicted transposase/invertase (TIGR01784 family)